MGCEEVRELLPDHALGTLDEVQATAVRRHLRGCGACRSDALALDRGVAMFASAAHEVEPPTELRERSSSLAHERYETDEGLELLARATNTHLHHHMTGRRKEEP